MAQMIGKAPFHAVKTDCARYDCGDKVVSCTPTSRSGCRARHRAAVERHPQGPGVTGEGSRAAKQLVRRLARTLAKPVAGGALALAAAGCSSAGSGNTNYSQFYQVMRQSLAASFGKVRVTRDQAASVPYASMGYSLDGGNQMMLVLATDSGGELLWTSAAHVVIVTRSGRIVRSVGLDHDISGLTTRGKFALPAPAAAIQGPFTSTRLEDFPELGLYGVLVSCRAQLAGRQSIKVLGQAVATVRVDESCGSDRLQWAFTDSFWVDADTGLVWRSRQHVHPKSGIVETEILRPPG
jgi:hypothetical protein